MLPPALTDAEGVIHYRLVSPHQREPVALRVLIPARPPPNPRLVFALPVEPPWQNQYGDGLAAIRSLGLHDRHGFVAAAPSFADWPWYADHPRDPRRADEAHLLCVVLPLLEELWRDRGWSPAPRPLLVGFSKSGWGAWTLLLRYPDRFAAAAAWDAPLMASKPESWEMPAAFGTLENFERYKITALLRQGAVFLRERTRLVLLGYGNFREHHLQTHALLEDLQIPHAYADGPERDHHWESGWMAEAVQKVIGLA